MPSSAPRGPGRHGNATGAAALLIGSAHQPANAGRQPLIQPPRHQNSWAHELVDRGRATAGCGSPPPPQEGLACRTTVPIERWEKAVAAAKNWRLTPAFCGWISEPWLYRRYDAHRLL